MLDMPLAEALLSIDMARSIYAGRYVRGTQGFAGRENLFAGSSQLILRLFAPGTGLAIKRSQS